MNSPALNSILEKIKYLSFDEQLFLSKYLEHLTRNQNPPVAFRSRLAVIQSCKPKILNLASKHGISNVRVFSLTLNEGGRTDNEIDFLVDLQPDKSLLDLRSFLTDLRELLGFKLFVFTENSLKEGYRDKVLQKAIQL